MPDVYKHELSKSFPAMAVERNWSKSGCTTLAGFSSSAPRPWSATASSTESSPAGVLATVTTLPLPQSATSHDLASGPSRDPPDGAVRSLRDIQISRKVEMRSACGLLFVGVLLFRKP